MIARSVGPTGAIHFTGSAIALIGTLGEACCESGHARVFVDGHETFDETGIWQDKSSLGRRIPGTILFAWRWPQPRPAHDQLRAGHPERQGRHLVSSSAGLPHAGLTRTSTPQGGVEWLSMPTASRSRFSSGTRLASISVALSLTAAVAASGATAAKTPVAKACPSSALIQATLRQKVTGSNQTLTPYTNSVDVHGQIRQCIYKTSLGTTITVAVTSGAQILAFVDAENAAFEANTGYQNSAVLKKHVIPVFGRGNDAWAIKEGGTLAALYQSNSVVITAPYTTVAQLKTLVQAMLGIPTPNAKNV